MDVEMKDEGTKDGRWKTENKVRTEK